MFLGSNPSQTTTIILCLPYLSYIVCAPTRSARNTTGAETDQRPQTFEGDSLALLALARNDEQDGTRDGKENPNHELLQEDLRSIHHIDLATILKAIVTMKRAEGGEEIEKDSRRHDGINTISYLLEDVVDLVERSIRLRNPVVKHVSLNNLNLVSAKIITDPGVASPDQTVFERTGTKPFMAIEHLLVEDPLKRPRRHDLESVIWALVWMCLREESWVTDPYRQVASSKAGYAFWAKPQTVPDDIAEKYAVLWEPVMKMALTWMTTWSLATATEDNASLTEQKVLGAIKVAPYSAED
ncbi:hypothetical protein FA13DRAFT_1816653 [Coprinellus micaceus]|uniref:Fungal-type protein kinase domain-containing protein n=1 Tax=Coprinellus micaceus TaxID=71717 RepID=A0A4Y7SY90_COPMI|nr:hypothetical protein FA13DRAFT_1816653 [Coprinellus micaceus]